MVPISRCTFVSLIVLIALCAVLGRLAFLRGIGFGFHPNAASLDSPYTTEEAWVTTEIASDIVEMAAGSARAPRAELQADARHAYTIDAGSIHARVDLAPALWSPAAFGTLARAALQPASAPAVGTALPSVREGLLEFTPEALVAAGDTVSDALHTDIRNTAAHEAAALTLAAFALRESSGRFHDVRWALNRITAHLALAQALGGSRPAGIDARLANAVLLAFTGDQATALQMLDGLDAEMAQPGVAAWVRAVRMRITDDWRLVDDPRHVSRLEQHEFVRARRVAVSGATGRATLAAIGVDEDPEWIRVIAASAPTGVADGSAALEAIEAEQLEASQVHAALFGRALDGEFVTAMNAPATRAMTSSGVDVLPWGAWAEFFQRHLAFAIARHDVYLRNTQGSPDAADAAKLRLQQQFGQLWSFPLATMFWNKGRTGSEGDSTYLRDAIAVLLAHPQRVQATTWARIELGTKYEPVRQGVPPPASWFVLPEPRSGYDLAGRFRESGHPRDRGRMEAALARTPYDWPLAAEYLTEKAGTRITPADVDQWEHGRLQYDLRPIQLAVNQSVDPDARIGLERRACVLSSNWCATLGKDLATLGRADDAARAYAAGFSDPGFDAVARANQSRWLVRYYAAHGQVNAALRLAREAAGTGAFQGLVTAARLYEQLERLDDAEEMFRESADHYDDWSELTAFYYRRSRIVRDRRYAYHWEEVSGRLFPNGLDGSAPPDAPPATGVLIESASADAVQHGFRPGDVIVAVDGWRVANVLQYRAVRAFPQEGHVVLLVWRGTRNEAITIPNRDFVPYFTIANHPNKGWIE